MINLGRLSGGVWAKFDATVDFILPSLMLADLSKDAVQDGVCACGLALP